MSLLSVLSSRLNMVLIKHAVPRVILRTNRNTSLSSSEAPEEASSLYHLNSPEPIKASNHDGVIDAPSPFEKPRRQCVLCRHNVPVDYKNIRLLSQFMSPFTGKVYDKHITGLCDHQQKRVQAEVKKARKALLVPTQYRYPRFNRDPALFNADRPLRPNPH